MSRLGFGYPLCRAVGDRHLTLELDDGSDPLANDLVHLTDRTIREAAFPGLLEVTPAHVSLLVRFNPDEASPGAVAGFCLEAAGSARASLMDGRAEVGEEPLVIVPVVYGSEWGPDLVEVGRETGLGPEEVASRHCRASYRVLMVGFAPGFPYLGGMDPSLSSPRLPRPRAHVPAGSVGLAGQQTGIYPHDLPGGWRIIGRTPLRLWRPEQEHPCLLGPGRRVRFVDCGRDAAAWARAVGMAGEPHARLIAHAHGPVNAIVRRSGPLTTVQDSGRWGYSRWGVPESGALDRHALCGANKAAGNEPGAAALEVTYGGLDLEFTRETVIAVSPGARAVLDGRRMATGEAVDVSPGRVLEMQGGNQPRSYVAFRGGISCPVVLGSRSTYVAAALGGIAGRALRRGDEIRLRRCRPAGLQAGCRSVGGWGRSPGRGVIEVRTVPGPQDHLFEPSAVAAFFSTPWRVTEAGDRRACILDGSPLAAPGGVGLSDGTPAGSVQVLPSGLPVVLLADHQPTGGYAKIGVVVEADLALVAQAWPGDVVRFVKQGGTRLWHGQAGAAVLRLRMAGRSHLVSIEPAPPR